MAADSCIQSVRAKLRSLPVMAVLVRQTSTRPAV
jgi:hypothetical protein